MHLNKRSHSEKRFTAEIYGLVWMRKAASYKWDISRLIYPLSGNNTVKVQSTLPGKAM